jgi:hypothetical protein
MNKLLFTIAIIFCGIAGRAQRIPISVNQVTGTASVVVPITSVSSGNITVPVSLAYGSNGIKLKDGEATAGLGWNLVAGGQVSRKVRGLPDDFKPLNDPRIGWLYNTNGTKAEDFTIANNTNPPNCTNETADINYINSNFADYSDTEPDLFSVNAPGLSCEFIFDKDRFIKPVPYQDLIIVPVFSGGTRIIGFTITNDKGTKYNFGQANVATKQTSPRLFPQVPPWPEANIKYFKTQYYQYLTGLYSDGVGYSDSWVLLSITDANGNMVSFDYTDMGTAVNKTVISVDVGGVGLDSMYVVNETNQVKVLSGIYGSGSYVSFTYGTVNNNITQGTSLGTITAKGIKYIFNYDAIYFKKGATAFNFNCLRYITTEQCSSPISYYFEYEGEVPGYEPGYSDKDMAFHYTDAWGYYTGIYSETIAAVNPAMVNAGMLKQVKYFDGGTTTFEYESNNYYDPTVSAVVNGGGVRIKKIIDYDGISTSNNMVHNYSYVDGSGISTGVPISLPQYTFLKPVASSPTTTNSTVSVNNDLSEEDHTIMYTQVKESQTNKGYTIYEYNVPAGAFATTAPKSDWFPTIAHAAVPGCSPSLGLVINQARTYPFAPNTNYDFDRGLLQKETSYNDSDVKVAESIYSYQRSYAPMVTYAFRYDDNDYARSYSKYSIYTNTSELITQIDKKVFDPSSSTVGQLDVTKFVYGAVAHKLVTQQEATGSDGSVTRTYISYAKDYDAYNSSNYTIALNERHMNVPLETYTEVKAAGESAFKVTSGQVTEYGGFAAPTSPDNYLPSTIYKFISATGLTDFAPTVTTHANTPDPRYILTNTFTNYNQLGILKSSVGIDRRTQTVLSDSLYQVPLAMFNNASPTEVGYGIDHSQANVFQSISGAGSYTTSRAGNLAATLFTANSTFTKAIVKKPWVKYYIFSAWIKSASAGSFNVNSVAATTVSVPLSYSGDNIWRYCEVKIPVTTLADYFTISFTAPAGISMGYDVLTYPGITNVSTIGYNNGYFSDNLYKVVETNTNGLSTYYQNDPFGRITLAFDNDKNITYRKTYNNFVNAYVGVPDPVFFPVLPVGEKEYYSGTSYAFAFYNSYTICDLPTPTFSWDYGDGSAVTSSDHHTYTTPGDYTITVTVTVAGYSPKTATSYIHIVAPPPHMAQMFYYNNTTTTNITKIEFWQGTTLIQTVNAIDIWAARIVPGSYTVKIYCYGEDTSISLSVDADYSNPQCKNWIHANIYSFDIDLNDYLPITLNPTPCE